MFREKEREGGKYTFNRNPNMTILVKKVIRKEEKDGWWRREQRKDKTREQRKGRGERKKNGKEGKKENKRWKEMRECRGNKKEQGNKRGRKDDRRFERKQRKDGMEGREEKEVDKDFPTNFYLLPSSTRRRSVISHRSWSVLMGSSIRVHPTDQYPDRVLRVTPLMNKDKYIDCSSARSKQMECSPKSRTASITVWI